MRFFDRNNEIKRLNEFAENSKESAQFTVVTGRRRIGKTQLLLRATEGQTTLYFFVTRKAEPFLCQDFQEEISNKLGIPVLGNIMSFGKLFQFLMQISSERHFTLINEIDLIAVNELDKTAHIVEIKRNKKHIRYNVLKEKAANMMIKTNRLKDYKIEYHGLSMDDM